MGSELIWSSWGAADVSTGADATTGFEVSPHPLRRRAATPHEMAASIIFIEALLGVRRPSGLASFDRVPRGGGVSRVILGVFSRRLLAVRVQCRMVC